MSTKTTFKRIALVAVAALGLGMVSTVPANATALTASSITVGTISPSRVGATSNATITFAMAAAAAGSSDTTKIAAKTLTAPATSRFIAATAISNASGARLKFATVSSSVAATSAQAYDTVTASSGLEVVATSATLTGASATVDNWTSYLQFTPDVAGTYTFLVSTNTSGTAFAAGDPSVIVTFTTTGVATSLTVTSINPTHGEYSADANGGSIVKVVAKDAAGAVTTPGENESFVVTTSGSFTITDITLTSGDFVTGAAYFNVYGAVSADTTEVITVKGSGGIEASVIATISIKAINTTSAVGNSAFARNALVLTGYATAAATPTLDSDLDYNAAITQTSHSIRLSFAAAPSDTVDTYYTIQVRDGSNKATGVTGGYMTLPLTIAAEALSGTVSVSASLGTSSEVQFTAVGGDSGEDTITIKGASAVATTLTADATIVRSAVGATNTISAGLKDQYGLAMPYQAVTMDVTGRNATSTAVNSTTDALGRVSFTLKDAGTVGTTDAIVLTSTDTEAVTIYYGTVTVGSVAVTGGASEDTVAYPNAAATTKAISTAATGANGATTTFTATVKDASGNLLSGVLVKWSVDKATAGITKTTTADASSCYTGSAGTCTTTVFSWAAPSKVTVTATAGDKTGTGYQNFVNAAADARVLSATVSGALAVAKVVDRFGNPVAGVTVSAKTSNGYFGSGATSTTGVTTEDGTVGFALTGNGTVTLSVDAATYTQAADIAGEVALTAVTAAVAGTTTGTGASLAPAGVAKVSVEITEGTNSSSQAAADAAAEATDAANAATDAANAAAEAADAATAAAQDAADAVAALSTQVSEMIDALKKQITALTNLVIKIQKKVKA